MILEARSLTVNEMMVLFDANANLNEMSRLEVTNGLVEVFEYTSRADIIVILFARVMDRLFRGSASDRASWMRDVLDRGHFELEWCGETFVSHLMNFCRDSGEDMEEFLIRVHDDYLSKRH